MFVSGRFFVDSKNNQRCKPEAMIVNTVKIDRLFTVKIDEPLEADFTSRDYRRI